LEDSLDVFVDENGPDLFLCGVALVVTILERGSTPE
jgi:hypothetical protein